MQIIPFWGCMISLKYPHMEKAIRYSMEKLGVELVNETRFSCCPDPIYFKAEERLKWLTVAARNISLAEEKGLDIITMCSGCTSTLCEANYTLKNNSGLKKEINKRLKKIDREYKGTVSVRHLVTLIRDDVKMEKIADTVKFPLAGLKVAIHYGCHLLKPSEIMNVDDPIIPSILADLLEITGVVPVNHKEYLLCCGKACLDQELTFNMSHNVFQSVADSGADCLGLICPTCFDSFDIGQLRINRKFKKDFQIPTLYYFQLLALAQGASLEEIGIHYHKIMPESFLEKIKKTKMAATS